ncbi:MAG TPA: GNAT family N-acetyltransferase [Ignavibacteria bacterium]|nr:GNAT family N-acetyltransferase [Bacteroidota bacterium]HRI86328.1 GNAT family N-acetyltransferase [Ignavibacteria bacterium]HRJ98294.1 GNAT family N-acetyltransferase [Ignavibacteria bacterium]
MKFKISEISKRPELIEKAIEYIWGCWGKDSNYKFYRDCILNSTDDKKALPKFYVYANKDEIIASYALLTNDLISRQDLMPWFACLYVNKAHRNKGIAGKLLEHGLQESKKKGFDFLYLATDHENFYEKKGWSFFTNGYELDDSVFKIYCKSTS